MSNSLNYFLLLPIEIIDLIFKFCAKSPFFPENNVFVQFKYIIQNPVCFKYNEYVGNMSGGIPFGTGTFTNCTQYNVSLPKGYQHSSYIISTIWLYKPLLYCIAKPTKYTLQYYDNIDEIVK